MAEQVCTTESLSVTTTCKDHQQQCIPVYCKDCKTSVCSVCVTEKHNTHHLTGIVDAANETQIDLQEVLQDKDRVLEHAHSLSSRLDDVINVCEFYKECLIQNISERAEKIIQETLKIKSELTEKVKLLSECYGRELSDAKCDTQTVIMVLNSLKTYGNFCRLNDVEKAHFKFKLKNVLKANVENLQHQSGFPFSFTTNDFRPQMFQSTIFGDIIDENEIASDFYDTNASGTVKGLNTEQDVPTEDSSDSEQYFDCEGDETTQETRVYKYQNCCIKNIVPVDAWNAYVLTGTDLCKMNFTKGEIISTPIMKNVGQISTTPIDTLLVIKSNSKTISHILKDGKIVTFCTSNRWQPTAVCASHKAFAIIVMFDNYYTHRFMHTLYVAEYNHNGVVVRKMMYKEYDFSYTFKYLFICHSSFDEVIYLTKNGIHICDAKLIVKKSYMGSIGPNPTECFCPTGICIDDKNQILVAVPHDNAIHLLDKGSNFIDLLLSEKDGVKRPCSVYLDKRGYLWVGTQNGKIIIKNYQK